MCSVSQQQLWYCIKSEVVCQELFSFLFETLSNFFCCISCSNFYILSYKRLSVKNFFHFCLLLSVSLSDSLIILSCCSPVCQQFFVSFFNLFYHLFFRTFPAFYILPMKYHLDVSRTHNTFYTIERRRRDSNPRAAINDLLPFQGSPFGQLGYFSKTSVI